MVIVDIIHHLANASALPILSVAMTTKLKQLTLVTMASQCRVMLYEVMYIITLSVTIDTIIQSVVTVTVTGQC